MKRLMWVWVALVILVSGGAWAQEEGFKPLFNGTDLKGWDGDPRFWSVKDGVITGETTKENPTEKNTFLVWRDGEVDDFELRFSFRIAGQNANSGVQIRSFEDEKWVIGGYQADIDEPGRYVGIIYDEKGKRGIMGPRGKSVTFAADGKKEEKEVMADAEILKAIKKGDWNDYVIRAEGATITNAINGVVTTTVVDQQAGLAKRSGLLALQIHVGPPMKIEFKNVRMKRLPLKDAKKIVLVSGKPSHALGEHEFPAGIHAIRNSLDQVPGVVAADYYEGWPADATAFDNADTILFYMDGGGGHPIIKENRLKELESVMARGVGMACVHYAVEIPKDKGGAELLRWIGGYYETGYSINPHWDGDFKEIAKHPIGNGVAPFKIRDEWYYNMRWSEPMDAHGKVTPILKSTPPDETRKTDAAKAHPGREEVVAWAIERKDGGRGFGFTGGHFHRNWGDPNFRKLVLNALVWTAKGEVPANGIEVNLSDEQLNGKLRKPQGQ